MKRKIFKITKLLCLLLIGILALYKPGIQKETMQGTWLFHSDDVPTGFPQIFLYMDNITLNDDSTFSQTRDGESFVTGNYYNTRNHIQFTTVKIGGIPNHNTYKFQYRLESNILILEKNGENLRCFEQ